MADSEKRKSNNWIYLIAPILTVLITSNWKFFSENIFPYLMVVLIPFIWVWENIDKVSYFFGFIFVFILLVRLWNLCDSFKYINTRLDLIENEIESLSKAQMELENKIDEALDKLNDISSNLENDEYDGDEYEK